MKLRAILAAGLGAALFAWLFWRIGPAAVLASVTAIGVGGFALIAAFQFGLNALVGVAWALLGRGRPDARVGRFVWARMVRDAATQVLPFTQVGGLALGGRALALEGVAGDFAFASTVADITLEFTTQLAYLAVGAVLLEALRPDNALGRPVAVVIVGLLVMAGALVVAQSRGMKTAARLVRQVSRGRLDGVAAWLAPNRLLSLRERAASVVPAWLLHLAAWLLTGVQAWIALRLLKTHVSLGGALVMDSLTAAAKALAFVVPGGLGVQEGALVALGRLFGVPPSAALALSLVRRGRDLVLSAPILGGWQLRHGGRIWTLQSSGAEGPKKNPAGAEP